MDGTVGYAQLRQGEITRTVQVTEDAMVDLDAQDAILGVETLSGGDWRGVLAMLAMSGRLTIPRSL